MGGLKLYCENHGYDGLVILLSVSDKRHHRQQLAVYSHNTDVLNQVNDGSAQTLLRTMRLLSNSTALYSDRMVLAVFGFMLSYANQLQPET